MMTREGGMIAYTGTSSMQELLRRAGEGEVFLIAPDGAQTGRDQEQQDGEDDAERCEKFVQSLFLLQ